ncbi:type VI secretion system amidase immunity protein Tai4 [Achromobacter arsenitoxydans]|uniref:type VI secretion system amidase immunity protein Tai4 n=1 Tax=Achromobacter arsenitoxydans TaxID=1147684 RepID=UPI001EE64A7D|nr:type VI secretion system amidase immunity protein Tai4 [Achromobacter arsenitoxydans]
MSIAIASVAPWGYAQRAESTPPEAYKRTYAQNYKDMVLATCLTNAYQSSLDAGKDIGSSVSALRDWTYYDLEQHPAAVQSLIKRYLARNYFNPLAEAEIKDVRFDFLKCLDLYHGEELDSLAKALVFDPDQTSQRANAKRKE